MSASLPADDLSRTAKGSALAVIAFSLWGAAPVYFRPLAGVPALEVIAHRITWSAVVLLPLAILTGRREAILRACRDRRVALGLALTAALIAMNWLVFVWAVGHRSVLDVSLGYFMNPLVNVALGAIVLGERMNRAQGVAVTIACASVLYLTLSLHRVPWIALMLALSFGAYGLLRKLLPVDALTGLLVETMLLLPAAAVFLLVLARRDAGALGAQGATVTVLLLLSGAWTAIPLLCFVGAARRLTLTAVGFFQYLAPSGQFVLAVIAWNEPFSRAQLLSFCGIWAALALVSVDALRRARAARGGG